MKRLNLFVLIALLVAAVSTYAQTTTNDVKILPCRESGFIRILFVGNQSTDVEVKFYNEQGLYTLDVIDKKSFRNGFVKKYDISQVHSGESFRIDVSANDFVATYEMLPKKLAGYEARLEHIERNYPMMAALKD